MRFCSQCGAENQEAAEKCRMCMHMLSGDHPAQSPPTSSALISTIVHLSNPLPLINCPHCAAPNAAEFNFCQACGSRLAKDEPREASRTAIAGSLSPLPQTDTIEAGWTLPATDATTVCPACRGEVVPGSCFCHLCGTPLAADARLAKASPTFRIRLIVDGEESEEVYPLGNTTVIGRLRGDIHFPDDNYMSSQHASIKRQGDRFFLKDEGSRNGTLIRIEGEQELKPGAVFLVGKQLFKFETSE